MEKQVGTPPVKAEGGEQEQKSTRTKTTLEELGRQLPIGIKTADGHLIKAFDYRRMKTKDERAISKAIKAKMTQGQHVSYVLAQMCDRIGPYEFDEKMKTEERIVRIGQMFMGDVMYAYMALRVGIMGPSIPLDVTCATCRKEFKYFADMNTTEVTTVRDESDLLWKYDLEYPIKLRGKEIKSFTVTTPRWFAISSLNEDDENVIKITTIRASIIRLNDDPDDVMLTDLEMDEIDKWDLEGIASRMDDMIVGPDMVVEGNCPKCGASFRWAIPWTYSSFFARSSR